MPHPFLDRPEVLQVLFYPRRDYAPSAHVPGVHSIAVEVEPGLVLGGRL